ncbi:hypothetical protein ACOMHN_041688 [Nucella lapillus]
MKARIRRDPTLSLHAVYEEVVSELPDDAEVPPFASVKSSLYRCRAAQMPAIPANIDNVVIEGVWSQTRDGRRFLGMLDRDMKARIRRDPTLSLHAVYEEVVSELPDDAEVPPFASVKSSLYRCRAAQMPAIPANIDNVVIEGDVTCSLTSLSPSLRWLSVLLWKLNSQQLKLGPVFTIVVKPFGSVPDSNASGPAAAEALGDLQQHTRHVVRKLMALAFLPVAVVRANFNLVTQEFHHLVRVDGVANLLQYFRRVFLDGFQPPRGQYMI